MPVARKNAPALLALALLGPALGTGPARAPVILGGHYDGGPNPPGDGNGYDTARHQSYVITPTATFTGDRDGLCAGKGASVAVAGGVFDDDRDIGLYAIGGSRVTVAAGTFAGNGNDGLDARGGAAVTVNGGAFTGNSGDGLYAGEGTAVRVTGGAFSGNLDGLASDEARVTITGGAFSDNRRYGVYTNNAAITIHGGAFTGNKGYALYDVFAPVAITGGVFGGSGKRDLFAGAGAPITLLGAGLAFAGSPVGTTTRVADDSNPTSNPTVTGTVTGRLRDNAAPSRLSFELNSGGSITLVNAPAPQPPGPGVSQPAPRP